MFCLISEFFEMFLNILFIENYSLQYIYLTFFSIFLSFVTQRSVILFLTWGKESKYEIRAGLYKKRDVWYLAQESM